MRVSMLKFPSGSNSPQKPYRKAALLTLTLLLGTLVLLHYMHDYFSFLSQSPGIRIDVSIPNRRPKRTLSPLQHQPVKHDDSATTRLGKKCNLFSGNWVPYSKGPYYTNETRCIIEKGQNCIKFGRPDTEYLKWRWKPDECELPLFDAAQFLEIVKGKALGFVGDSLARNHVQSLGCLLTSVSRPVERSNAKYPRTRRWVYPDYNFTLALLLTTHLVKSTGINAFSGKPAELYLDEAEESWAAQIHNFDFVIISSGHWFSRPLTYLERNEVIGCSMCTKENVTDLTRFYGYRKAIRSALRKLLDHRGFKGTIILRTITPPHFEGEDAEGRGNCVRTRPFGRDEVTFDWDIWMYYLVQVEEFLAAKTEGEKRGLKFRLLDITDAMRPRPDGHPNHYGQPPEMRFMLYSDCLHWCLPGPIDTWNELLLQVLKTGDGLD